MNKTIFFFLMTCIFSQLQGQDFSPAPPPPPQTPEAPAEAEGAAEFEFAEASAQAYPHPGLVTSSGAGTDNLYNLTANIEVEIEVVAPREVNLDVLKKELRGKLESAFKKVEIKPFSSGFGAVLPLYHVLIMVDPINRGYAGYVESRLFESVKLDRIKLPEGSAFQAITWETQTLLVTPEGDLESEITRAVMNGAQLFSDRFSYYDNLRIRKAAER